MFFLIESLFPTQVHGQYGHSAGMGRFQSLNMLASGDQATFRTQGRYLILDKPCLLHVHILHVLTAFV